MPTRVLKSEKLNCVYIHTHICTAVAPTACWSLEQGGNSQGGDSENTHYTSAFICTVGLGANALAVLKVL